jgi:hypothetical protein
LKTLVHNPFLLSSKFPYLILQWLLNTTSPGIRYAKLSSESALFGLKDIPGDRNEILDMHAYSRIDLIEAM